MGLLYRLNKYFSYSGQEALQALATAVIAGFAISFNNWGEPLNISVGIRNLVLGIVFVMIAVSLQTVAQKTLALAMGYVLDYSYWKLGLLVSFLVTFLTNGVLPLFFTGTVECKIKQTLRTGIHKPRFKQWEYGVMSLAGPVSSLLIVLILQPIYLSSGSPVLFSAIEAFLLVMIFSMIPIPLFHGVKVISGGRTQYDFQGGTVGFNVFYSNRGLYFFLAFLMLAYFVLVYYFATASSFILSILIAIILLAVVITKTNGL